MSASRATPSFSWYLRHKLGRQGGRAAWFNFFIRPFTASSFAEFWRMWNPVYGYYLTYYSYRPLARTMPRDIAALLTFVACGFLLHDVPAWLFTRRVLPPGATIALTVLGAGSMASEKLHMDMSHLPVGARAALNVAYLGTGVGAMLLVVRLMARK